MSLGPPDHQLGARLRFPSVAGKRYRVEFRDDLAAGSWHPLTNGLPGTGSAIELTDPAAATPQRFYRIALEP